MTGAPSLDLRESVWRAATRWGACLVAVLMAHGAIAAGLMAWPQPEDQGAPPPSPILIDLTPAATPMASIEDVSKLIADAEPPPAVPQTVRSPLHEMAPTPQPPPEVKIEITIDIPPPEPPPPVDLKPPPPKVVHKPLPKPPEKVARRAQPSRAPPSPAPSAEASGAPSPASPASAPVVSPKALATWRGALFAHLARHKRYPSAARSRGDEGVVHVRFTVSRQGMVTAQSVVRPSGHALLDLDAVDLLRRAQPLPAPPADMPGNSIEVIVPLQYSLR